MLLRQPDFLTLFTDAADEKSSDAKAWCELKDDVLKVYVASQSTGVKHVRLEWRFTSAERRRDAVKVLGDCWERGYGDLQWAPICPQTRYPWTVCVSNGSDGDKNTAGRFTECFGVKARPGAMVTWQYEQGGVTLNLDTRSGGVGVVLGGRTLTAAEVKFGEYKNMSAFAAVKAYYKTLCDDAIFPSETVYGSNNWYYAYGKSDRKQIIRDAALIAELCPDYTPRPFMVIDAGWTAPGCIGEEKPVPDKYYGDMKTLAQEIASYNVKPGIWVRYLADEAKMLKEIPDEWRLSRDKRALDPSHPGVLEFIKEATRIITYDWGYKLIKHDFSNVDVFGLWGFQAESFMPDGGIVREEGWKLFRSDLTTAEVFENMYKTIYEAALPGTVIIGCNVAGFLSAGYCHINRTGDDTSGIEWERTRRMGVNTVAFRNMYDGTFYKADCDCVGVKGLIPWNLNKKWAQLISYSGTPLFFSTDPDVPSENEKQFISECLKRGSEDTHTAVPLDWMETTCPEKWLLDGEEVTFDWSERAE